MFEFAEVFLLLCFDVFICTKLLIGFREKVCDSLLVKWKQLASNLI